MPFLSGHHNYYDKMESLRHAKLKRVSKFFYFFKWVDERVSLSDFFNFFTTSL